LFSSDGNVKINNLARNISLLFCNLIKKSSKSNYLSTKMALIHTFEEQGNKLFRYRGQIPVILFLLAIPVVYFTDYSWISLTTMNVLTAIAICISFIGFLIRAYSIGTTPKGTSGRNRDSQVAESLNTTGIYSMVRHPLYLGKGS
jgi:protein-S-isoprenylcysteine O-methyltransferase Ste14